MIEPLIDPLTEPVIEPNAQATPFVRAMEPDEANIRQLVDAFYRRVDDDSLLGPIFARELAGRWDAHLAKMTTFWSSLVLGTKAYRGNVQEAHRPLGDIEPQHFARWLTLFLDTVNTRYEPAAAVLFMEPALRIVQERAMKAPREAVQIVQAQLGTNAGLIGAGALVYSQLQIT